MGMTTQEKIDQYFWYHRIDLGGIMTPGCLPHWPKAYKVPDDLTGKRVLDVGAWDGYWTFEALKRGADSVLAIDNWSDIPLLDKTERVPWDTFDLCQEVLGYSAEQVTRKTMSVYDIDPEIHGQFDVVFFFGALYHCRHPLLALDKLSAACRGDIYIESAICDDYSAYRGLGAGYANRGDMVCEFFPHDEFANIATNWWSPSLICMVHMVESAGFVDLFSWKFSNPTEIGMCRGFCKGRKI